MATAMAGKCGYAARRLYESEIFRSLAEAETAHPLAMLLYESPHPVGIGARIVAQTPADGFIDEKLPAAEIGYQYSFQQAGVGELFSAYLVVNGYASYPEVFIFRPFEHQRGNFGIVKAEIAENAVQPVDAVPPLLGAGKSLKHRKMLRAEKTAHGHEIFYDEILKFAVLICPASRKKIGVDDPGSLLSLKKRLAKQPALRRRNPVEGEFVSHICRHGLRFLRRGGRLKKGLYVGKFSHRREVLECVYFYTSRVVMSPPIIIETLPTA